MQSREKTPPLNIKDPAAYSLASDIARLTGKSLTRVVVDALRKDLQNYAVKTIDHQALRELLDRVDARPRRAKPQSEDEILGYNAEGKWF